MKKIVSLVLSVLILVSVMSSVCVVSTSATAVNTAQTAGAMTLGNKVSYTFKRGYPTHTYNPYYNENEIYYTFTPSSTGYYEFIATGYDATKYSVGYTPSISITVKDSTGKSVLYGYTNDTTLETKKAAKLYKGEKYYIDLYDGGIGYLSDFKDIPNYGYAEETISLVVKKHTHTYDVQTYSYSNYKYASYDCRYCDYYKTGYFYKPETIKLSCTKYTYDGKVKKPKVTVKGSDGKTIDSSNYTVSYSSGRKKIGKYTVKVKFKKQYEEFPALKKTFTINPKGTSLSSLKKGKKAFTAKWKKQTKNTSGYQIQYATNSSFYSAKTVTVKGNTKTYKKVSKLYGYMTYYVRVRTYKTVSGKKYYSSWSSKKSVATAY